MKKTQLFHHIILGAGAAGLLCAIEAGSAHAPCAIVDWNDAAGFKIVASGGGHANFTNLHMNSSFFIGEDPFFAETALSIFTPKDMIKRLHSWHIPFEERDEGQLFCATSARHLRDALVNTAQKAHTSFFLKHTIEKISYEKEMFVVTTDQTILKAPILVLATGHKAWPQGGASDIGIQFAKEVEHTIIPAQPALVPFKIPNTWPLHGLTGISLSLVQIHVAQKTVEGGLLFTHKGISGPGVLRASCYWKENLPITIDFSPTHSIDSLLTEASGKQRLKTLLFPLFPKRFIEALFSPELLATNIASISKANRQHILTTIHAHTVIPSGTLGFSKAEAVRGGVSTREINPHTFESLLYPNLYMIGELLDITGQLGGYNLHWAWASGASAGRHIAIR